MDENHPSGVSFQFQSLFSEPKPKTPPPEIIDMTKDDEEQVGFCSGCLQDLNNVNFLLQMKHVKECSRKRRESGVLEQVSENSKLGLITGKQALIDFLLFYGYESIACDFVNHVKTLSNLRSMDVVDLEKLTGVKGLSERKRLVFALEQYKQRGHLQQRKSQIIDKRKHNKSNGRGNTKSLKHMCVDDTGGIKQNKKKKDGAGDAQTKCVLDIDKILLDTLWRTTDDTKGNLIEGNTSHIYEGRMVWCHRIVSREQSLWFGAADCSLCLAQGSLEERLRSGSRMPVVEQPDSITNDRETLAMKHVRLKALKDELQVHVSTVEELRSMIHALEQEIKEYSMLI